MRVRVCRMPIFSLGARLDGAGKATKSPGPATYPPNLYNVKKVGPSAPSATRRGLSTELTVRMSMISESVRVLVRHEARGVGAADDRGGGHDGLPVAGTEARLLSTVSARRVPHRATCSVDRDDIETTKNIV